MSKTNEEKIKEILDLIDDCGGIDGAHHKQWVLDQIVRILTGDGYADWVIKYRGWDHDNGCSIYEWNEGIAP